MSNKSFTDKKKIIKENSKAVILNSDVWDKETWTINDIKSRGERLANIVLGHYASEKINDDSIEFDYVSKVTLNDDPNIVTGRKIMSFTYKGETYQQNRYALMLLDMIRLLDKEYPGKLEMLARNNFTLSKNSKHAEISYDKVPMRWAWEIRDGIYMEASHSASKIMSIIGVILDAFEVDRSQFYVSLVAQAEDEDDGEDLAIDSDSTYVDNTNQEGDNA